MEPTPRKKCYEEIDIEDLYDKISECLSEVETLSSGFPENRTLLYKGERSEEFEGKLTGNDPPAHVFASIGSIMSRLILSKNTTDELIEIFGKKRRKVEELLESTQKDLTE